MVRVHIWLRKKEDMPAEEFRDYWLSKHAPIARDGYEQLRGYEVDLVTRVPEGLKYAKPAAEFPPLITELLAKVPAAP